MSDIAQKKPETFGEALRRVRKARGLSMSDVARKVGVGKNAVSGWETQGKHPAPIFHADLLKFDPSLRDALFAPENQSTRGRYAKKTAPSERKTVKSQEATSYQKATENAVTRRAMRILTSIRAIEHNEDVIRTLREAEKAEISISDLLVLLCARSE